MKKNCTMCNLNNCTPIFASNAETSKREHSLLLTAVPFFPVGNTQKRLQQHKERREEIRVEGERGRMEKVERILTTRLQHYPTTSHPRGSWNFESTSTRSLLPFTSPLLSRLAPSLLLSVFPSITQHEKSARRGGRKDDAFGKLRRHARAPTWHSIRPSESDGQRGKAEGNAQFATYGLHWYSP